MLSDSLFSCLRNVLNTVDYILENSVQDFNICACFQGVNGPCDMALSTTGIPDKRSEKAMHMDIL